MSRIPFFLLTFTLAHLSAQNVRIGMKGGLRATNDIESRDGKASESRPYALGPMLEVGLPLGLSVEADALYSRIGYSADHSYPLGYSINRGRATSWEFPVLLKRSLPFPLLHPYVSAGYAPRRVSGEVVSTGFNSDYLTSAHTPFRGTYPERYTSPMVWLPPAGYISPLEESVSDPKSVTRDGTRERSTSLRVKDTLSAPA